MTDTPEQSVTTFAVARDTGLPHGTVATTPYYLPNVIVTTLTPIWIVFVRTTRVYLQTLLGLLLAGGLGTATNTLPVGDFWHLLRVSAGLSVASAVVCALQNALELLSRIDQSHPELRA